VLGLLKEPEGSNHREEDYCAINYEQEPVWESLPCKVPAEEFEKVISHFP